MRILVTGGAGFIGSHIVHWLRKAGCEVVVADNLRTGQRANLPDDVPFYEVDIRDQAGLANLFAAERPQAVVHQAAMANVRESMEDPITYAEVNIIGTLHLLELVKDYDCSKFIFASTGGAVYGEGRLPNESAVEGDEEARLAPSPPTLPFTEDSPPQPMDNYGANKLSCEHYIELYHQNYGLPYVILRYANVYGPRQDVKGEAGVVAIFSGAMLADQATFITGDGGQQRDFVYVDDVARANILALNGDLTGTYNVGTGLPTNINTLYRLLADLTGYGRKPAYRPRPAGEVRATWLDCSKAGKELGWEAEIDLREGLRRTVEWARKAAATA
ncbi:MAG: NAD-dependent epimerase/dehydratase family protein [Caldilineaceae bacterium SB0668_bin_21]|nr:NAD-dependent epimerase/dehydratase family protein [Caldilineaceae bacterium SB0668_bin_21]MYC21227.1 NAD-dependent epimerase/dehydratase family protein [Caldilineaceae bacterium SB0662_bin_25]